MSIWVTINAFRSDKSSKQKAQWKISISFYHFYLTIQNKARYTFVLGVDIFSNLYNKMKNELIYRDTI